jgi:hypothetical protein
MLGDAAKLWAGLRDPDFEAPQAARRHTPYRSPYRRPALRQSVLPERRPSQPYVRSDISCKALKGQHSPNTSLHRTPAALLSSGQRGVRAAPVSSKPLGGYSR